MNISNKILVVVFIVLLIITGAELFYFFYSKPPITGSVIKNQSLMGITPLTIPAENLVINRDQIKYLNTLRKIDTDQLKAFYSMGGIGIVSNIKRVADKQIFFDLIDENGKKSTNIKFPIIENIPFQIYKSDNNVMTVANLKDVADGDKIKFLWIYDLSKPPGNEDIYNNELIIYNNSSEKIY